MAEKGLFFVFLVAISFAIYPISATQPCHIPVGGLRVHGDFAFFAPNTWRERHVNGTWGEYYLKPYTKGASPQTDLILLNNNTPFQLKGFDLYFHDILDSGSGCIKETKSLATKGGDHEDPQTFAVKLTWAFKRDGTKALGEYFKGSTTARPHYGKSLPYDRCIAYMYEKQIATPYSFYGISWNPKTEECLPYYLYASSPIPVNTRDDQDQGASCFIISQKPTPVKGVSPTERIYFGHGYTEIDKCIDDVVMFIGDARMIATDGYYCVYTRNENTAMRNDTEWTSVELMSYRNPHPIPDKGIKCSYAHTVK